MSKDQVPSPGGDCSAPAWLRGCSDGVIDLSRLLSQEEHLYSGQSNIFAFESENQRFRAGNDPPLLLLVQTKPRKVWQLLQGHTASFFAKLGQQPPCCLSFLIPLHLSRAPLWARSAVARRDLSMTSDEVPLLPCYWTWMGPWVSTEII